MAFDNSRAFKIRNERVLILFLCIAAAVRVFVFSAAFPFFTNVDEDLHFDLITRYGLSQLPRGLEPLKEESLAWIVPYASPEFLVAPEELAGSKFPLPLWKQTGPDVGEKIAVTRAAWSKEINFESSQPPLYYVLASIWWSIGKHIGFAGIESLYWIRFLNVLLIAVAVWLGYVVARVIAPHCVELRIGVPLLLAFIPQSVFYAINNDVLSPVCCGALFLCLLQWLRTNTPGFLLGAVTGLAIAAAYLTKVTNLPIIVVALAIIIARSFEMLRRKSRTVFVPLAVLFFFAAIPIGGWMFWLTSQFGDVTGSAAKIAFLDWTPKPFTTWWQHPIFTPRGVRIFWSDLIASFFRGEVEWHRRPFDWRIADVFYAVSSFVFFLAAVVGLRKRSGLSAFQRHAIGVAVLMFTAALAFLGLLSIQFDFGSCVHPSRVHPYFTSGRLLSGAMIPFGLIYVYGIISLLRFTGGIVSRAVWIDTILVLVVLVVIAVFGETSEILIRRPVFASEHNWFRR